MMFREVEVVYSEREVEGKGRILCASDAARIAREAGIVRKPREVFLALHLDSRHNCIAVETVAVGTLSSVSVHPREVFRGAILAGAKSIIIAHNHPSNDATPSVDDIALTERMQEVGELIGIPVLDHVVVTEHGYRAITEL